MGTNYYIATLCPHCNHFEEKLHIGKSSYGWVFSLHVTDEIKTLGDWITRLTNLQIINGLQEKIYDEYCAEITLLELLDVITKRGDMTNPPKEGTSAAEARLPHSQLYESWDDFHIKNNSLFGPNGLYRHKIDGRHCVGHGDGTWDLISGTFS